MKLLFCYNKFLIIFIICNSNNIIKAHIFENRSKWLLTCPMLCLFDLENCWCQSG